MFAADGGLVGDPGYWQRKGGQHNLKQREGLLGAGRDQRFPRGRSGSSRMGGRGWGRPHRKLQGELGSISWLEKGGLGGMGCGGRGVHVEVWVGW